MGSWSRICDQRFFLIESHFIYGKTPKRRRDEVLRAFERREFNVLIGGKIINRGLDLDGGCENLIIATGGKLRSDFMQKVGRALRHNKYGKSKVYDFYFRCNKYLYEHSKARLRTMVDAEYKSTVVFKNGSVDGAKHIKSRVRIPIPSRPGSPRLDGIFPPGPPGNPPPGSRRRRRTP